MPVEDGPAAPAGNPDHALGYLLVRLTIGASLFGHGVVRLPKLGAFHAHMMGEFTTSYLPGFLVSACSYVIPFAELATGVLLVLGALTRVAAVTGGLVMIVLVVGATSIEHFDVVGEQLVHAILLAAVVAFARHNKYSVDQLLARRSSASAGGGR